MPQLLDEKYKIAMISLSRSLKLRNQCFLTFVDGITAKKFQEQFGPNLRISGRKIDIELANKDSLLGLSLEGLGLLNRALKTRALKKRLVEDSALKESYVLRRRMRRLRNKLRRKGIADDEIAKIVEDTKKKEQRVLFQAALENNAVKKADNKGEKRPSTTAPENLPNKILLVQNLPRDATQEGLRELFRHDSLVEIRLVSVRNVAFVEYQSAADAKQVKDSLGATFNLADHEISIGFAK